MTNDYQRFLESKIELASENQSLAQNAELDSSLFPHQRDIARWALSRERALIAASFGLGKTRVQISIAKALHTLTGNPFLIVCPLGVKHQFQEEDGPALNTEWRYVRTNDEARNALQVTPYLITNYERVRDGNIVPAELGLCGASLDEGSIIGNLGTKTYDVFLRVFGDLAYRYVCTATPSPNDYKQLIYYANWLGVMDSGQALTRWFRRNPDKAGDLRLLPQWEEEFWLWVKSWALFVEKPSDLGYSDEGYTRPPLRIHYHMVPTDHTRAGETVDRNGQRSLVVNMAAGIGAETKEKRATLNSRVAKAKEIMAAEPGEHWLLWHDLEDERRAIEKQIPEAKTVYGSQDIELREQRILDFARGKFEKLATKPSLAGSGCNFQLHCSRNIFLAPTYKAKDIIQAIYRTQRFQQPNIVDVHFIYSEAQQAIFDKFKQKWEQHNKLAERMSGLMRQYGLSHVAAAGDLKRRIGVERIEERGEMFTMVHNDCVNEVSRIPDNSVGVICSSFPFLGKYQYTDLYEDFGFTKDPDEFFAQCDFLIPHLCRMLKPGRIAAMHCKDIIRYGHQTESGFMDVQEFSDMVVAAMKKHGFLYQGRRTVVTDVVRENNATYRLTYGEMVKDASKMGSGLPEYILLFRKPPSSNAKQYADEPVKKNRQDYSLARWQIDADELWRSGGHAPEIPADWLDLSTGQVMAMHKLKQLSGEPYDYEAHVAIGEALGEADQLSKEFSMLSPKVTLSDSDMVWDNVNFLGNLNAAQFRNRQANHLCPLPFDLCLRLINLYSNEGDLVFDPFGGLGTVPYCAVKLKRKAYAVELNKDYFEAATRYLREIEREVMSPSLFDLIEQTATVPVDVEVKPFTEEPWDDDDESPASTDEEIWDDETEQAFDRWTL